MLSLSNHRQRLFPFVLSLSKQERTPRLSSPNPSTSSGRTDWKGVLRQASFDRLMPGLSNRMNGVSGGVC
ncbi:MAG: hypothetical protein LBD67_03450 [Candidatus Accumulibacter sp.]|nr:hypothetical protein [Accumulibacter sp.]